MGTKGAVAGRSDSSVSRRRSDALPLMGRPENQLLDLGRWTSLFISPRGRGGEESSKGSEIDDEVKRSFRGPRPSVPKLPRK